MINRGNSDDRRMRREEEDDERFVLSVALGRRRRRLRNHQRRLLEDELEEEEEAGCPREKSVVVADRSGRARGEPYFTIGSSRDHDDGNDENKNNPDCYFDMVSVGRPQVITIRILTVKDLRAGVDPTECPIATDSFDRAGVDCFPEGTPLFKDYPEGCVAALPCGHMFGALPLVYSFVTGTMRCPMCRQGVNKRMRASCFPKHLRGVVVGKTRELAEQERAERMDVDSLAIIGIMEEEEDEEEQPHPPNSSMVMTAENTARHYGHQQQNDNHHPGPYGGGSYTFDQPRQVFPRQLLGISGGEASENVIRMTVLMYGHRDGDEDDMVVETCRYSCDLERPSLAVPPESMGELRGAFYGKFVRNIKFVVHELLRSTAASGVESHQYRVIGISEFLGSSDLEISPPHRGSTPPRSNPVVVLPNHHHHHHHSSSSSSGAPPFLRIPCGPHGGINMRFFQRQLDAADGELLAAAGEEGDRTRSIGGTSSSMRITSMRDLEHIEWSQNDRVVVSL